VAGRALGHHGDQVGALQQERRQQEALHRELDPARHAGPGQVGVDDRDRVPAHRGVDQVTEPQVRLHRHHVADLGGARPDAADPAVGEQPQAGQRHLGHDLDRLDHQVGLALAEQADRVRSARQHLDGQAGSGRGQPPHQRADEHEQAVVRAAHRERGLVGGGVESRPVVQCVLDQAERVGHRLAERFGARGRDQRQALAHQQRVAEQLAQPGERVAHPGLTQPDPFGRPGDAALGEQRVERHEEVEVDARKAHLPFLAGFIAVSNDLHS
jgi:hypothetical protein